MTVDGCPTPGCDNTEPETSRIDLPHVVRASYVCADCGAAWLTDYPRED